MMLMLQIKKFNEWFWEEIVSMYDDIDWSSNGDLSKVDNFVLFIFVVQMLPFIYMYEIYTEIRNEIYTDLVRK